VEAIGTAQSLIGKEGNKVSSSYKVSTGVEIEIDSGGNVGIFFSRMNLQPIKEKEATKRYLLALAMRKE
jgi:hypothetical protein